MIGVETWTLRKTHRKYLGNVVLETNGDHWDRLRGKYVLHKVKEETSILRMTKCRKANGVGHILRRNFLLQYCVEQKVEGRIDVTERQGITRKQLLDDLEVKRGYCELKEKELARTLSLLLAD